MEREPRTRIWPYVVLLLCLFALSLIAPTFWRMCLQTPPRLARPIEGFSLSTAPRENVAADRQRDLDEMPTAPELLTLSANARDASSDEMTPAERDAWEALTDPAVASSNESSGKIASYGSLFAERAGDEATDEVLPPISPQMDADLADEQRLRRAGDRLARHAVSDNEQRTAATVWPRPHALIEQLQAIDGHDRCQSWASDVLIKLESLAMVEAIDTDRSASILSQLETLAGEVDRFIRRVRDAEVQALVLSARDALHRRVRIWRQVRLIADRDEPTQFVAHVADELLLTRIDRALGGIGGRRAPPAWSDYLGLDELQEAIAAGPVDIYDRAAMASFALNRLNSPRLNPRQRELLNTRRFRELEQALRQLATQPADESEVIYTIEEYERTRTPTDGQRLAAATAKLRWSTDEDVAELARRIDENYRTANVRLAITGELLNRSLPRSESKSEDVNEQILSSWVAGQRDVQTQLSVKLAPDANRWRMSMQAEGAMASDTASYAGNATLLTQGSGEFSASKQVVVDHHHIHVWPAQAEASYQGQLYGVSTSMDSIPIISRIARSTASDNYYQSQWAARQEIEAKLEKRAKQLLDTQTMAQLTDGEARLRKRLLPPLSNTGVEAIPMRLLTTQERLVGQYRLASGHQLGGHTPRPWAPRNALMSVQIHETAINNVIAGLRLDGRQGHVRDLFREIYAVFGRDDFQPPASMPENVTVLFAEEDAVRVSLQDGRMEVILQLAELRTDNRIWRELLVRNYYAPDMSSLEAKLIRDSTVRLKGQRLGIRDQVALRGIFTKIFGDNREFSIIPAEMVDGAGMEGLAITQYVIRDGWLGVAIAPPHRGLNQDTTQAGPLDRQARRTHVKFE